MMLPKFTDTPRRLAIAEFDRGYLAEHLHRCDGNVAQAARVVGMERSSLHRKLREYGITTERLTEAEWRERERQQVAA